MYKEMSKGKALLMAFAIWLSGFGVMFSMLPIVITNDLYIAFPNTDWAITAALSWPGLVVAIVGAFAGKLLSKISTKKELIIGTILITFGVVPAFVNSAEMFLVVSLIQGAGAGFVNTAGMAMISEVFLDEKTRSRQMGFYNAAGSVMGFLLTYIAGFMAVNGWQPPFNLFWFAVPVLVLVIIFTPEIRPSERHVEVQNVEVEDSGEKVTLGSLGGRFWSCFAGAFVWFLAYCCFFTFMSVYIDENAIGDVTFTGLCTSISTVGSLLSSLLFGFIYGKVGRKVNIICAIVPLLLYVWAFMAPGKAVTFIFSLVYGFCYGVLFTSIYAYGAEVVTAKQNGFAMGLMTFNYSVGMLLGINIFQPLMVRMGGLTKTMPIAMVILAVAAIIEIIGCRKDAVRQNNG